MKSLAHLSGGAPKDNVIYFPVKAFRRRRSIVSVQERAGHYELVAERSFKLQSVEPGDVLIIRRDFDLSEVTPATICHIEFWGKQYAARIRMLTPYLFEFVYDDRRRKSRVRPIEQLKIFGIAVEVRRAL